MWSYLRDRICLSDVQIRLFWGYCLALLPFVQSCPRFVAAVGYTYRWKLYIRLSLNKIKSEILTFPHHLERCVTFSFIITVNENEICQFEVHIHSYLLPSSVGELYREVVHVASAGCCCGLLSTTPRRALRKIWGKCFNRAGVSKWLSHFGDVTPVLYFSIIKHILFFKSSRLIILEKEELVAKLRAYHRWNCYLTFTYSYVDN